MRSPQSSPCARRSLTRRPSSSTPPSTLVRPARLRPTGCAWTDASRRPFLHAAAKMLKQEGKLGVVAPGSFADLLILNRNPLVRPLSPAAARAPLADSVATPDRAGGHYRARPARGPPARRHEGGPGLCLAPRRPALPAVDRYHAPLCTPHESRAASAGPSGAKQGKGGGASVEQTGQTAYVRVAGVYR